MKRWVYRWLPIVFGCHCREDRSFHFRGERFPICARCTGELAGMVLVALTYALGHAGAAVSLLLMVPMVLDGTVQRCTAYESTNLRRFVTGLLFGYALVNLFLVTTGAVYRLGLQAGARMIG